MEKIYAIVLAAGKGRRMESDVAKQYLEIHGKPIIYYALKAFEDSDVDEVVLVCGEDEIDYCKQDIVEKYELHKVSAIVAGGSERYNSVYNGLREINNCGYVLIHDGARPCITPELINRTIESVVKMKACVVGMPVKDTIKVVDQNGIVIETPERSTLMITQTPQAFEYSLICEAYKKLKEQSHIIVTDDAMVVETMLHKNVHMVKGSYENIKVTTPEDLNVIKEFLKN